MHHLVKIISLAALAAGCRTMDKESISDTPERQSPATVVASTRAMPTITEGPNAPVKTGADPAQAGNPSVQAAAYDFGGVASCRPDAEMSATVSRAVSMADRNGDGKISRDEANTLSNFMVGGFFFRADANGDGTITPEEGRQARAEFANDHPAVASFVSRAAKATGGSSFASMAKLVDVDYGKPLTTAEARDAARAGVDDLFRVADTDHDGFITSAEMRAVALEGVHKAGQEAFKAADTDHSGGLDLHEFQTALDNPIKVAFALADTNKDGQLTEPEAEAAMSQLATRVSALEPSATVTK